MAEPKPRRGDVESVELVENDRVKIRLFGHPFDYCVRVVTSTQSGPELAELVMTADEGAVVDYDALRAIPARRLATSAAQAMARLGGNTGHAGRRWRYVDDRVETFSAHGPHEQLPLGVYRAVAAAEEAQRLGQPIRATVAAQLQVSTRTVDRYLVRARAAGLIGDLPKRPPPRQRDTTE